MDRNWEHRFITRHPLVWGLIRSIVDAVLFVVKVWASILIIAGIYIWVTT